MGSEGEGWSEDTRAVVHSRFLTWCPVHPSPARGGAQIQTLPRLPAQGMSQPRCGPASGAAGSCGCDVARGDRPLGNRETGEG